MLNPRFLVNVSKLLERRRPRTFVFEWKNYSLCKFHNADRIIFKLIYFFSFLYAQDNARVGDDFMNQIQAIAAYVPYMTCPGNHEQA